MILRRSKGLTTVREAAPATPPAMKYEETCGLRKGCLGFVEDDEGVDVPDVDDCSFSCELDGDGDEFEDDMVVEMEVLPGSKHTRRTQRGKGRRQRAKRPLNPETFGWTFSRGSVAQSPPLAPPPSSFGQLCSFEAVFTKLLQKNNHWKRLRRSKTSTSSD